MLETVAANICLHPSTWRRKLAERADLTLPILQLLLASFHPQTLLPSTLANRPCRLECCLGADQQFGLPG